MDSPASTKVTPLGAGGAQEGLQGIRRAAAIGLDGCVVRTAISPQGRFDFVPEFGAVMVAAIPSGHRQRLHSVAVCGGRQRLRVIGLFERNSDSDENPFRFRLREIVVVVPAVIAAFLGERHVQTEKARVRMLRRELDRHPAGIRCQAGQVKGSQILAGPEAVSEGREEIELRHPATSRTQAGQTVGPSQYTVGNWPNISGHLEGHHAVLASTT